MRSWYLSRSQSRNLVALLLQLQSVGAYFLYVPHPLPVAAIDEGHYIIYWHHGFT